MKSKNGRLYFTGKATPGGKLKDHEIPTKLWYDHGVAVAELAGRQAQVGFVNGSASTLALLDAEGNPIGHPQPQPPSLPKATIDPPSSSDPATATSKPAPTRKQHYKHYPKPPIAGEPAVEPGEAGFVPAYNFIPLIDRSALPEPLTDGPAAGHDRYLDDRWTGTIQITITTRTPLLIPDHAAAEAVSVDGVNVPTYPTRADGHGRPMLDGSAVKGMLRASYEAITASRLGVFGDHSRRLAVRSKARADYYPAVVTRVNPETRDIHVVRHIAPAGLPALPGQPDVNQVWVNKAEWHHLAPNLAPTAELDTPEVYAWIQLCKHHHPDFYMWRAVSMAPVPAGHPAEPAEPAANLGYPYKGWTILVHGRLHWTDAPFGTKHDERLVVTDIISAPAGLDVRMQTLTLDADGIADWVGVIDSYRSVTGRGDNPELGDYAVTVAPQNPDRWIGLDEHRTLHVKIDKVRGIDVARYPSPAMIGREAFQHTPMDLLGDPADELAAPEVDELSPAERVFGWTKKTRQPGDPAVAAHRGHVRIDGCVERKHTGQSAIHSFTGPVALATLNSPKPAQYRFYLRNETGTTIGTNSTTRNDTEQGRNTGYREKDIIAGRKVYLYDARLLGAAEYWQATFLRQDPGHFGGYTQQVQNTPVTVQGTQLHREYSAPQNFKPKTVTLIKSWVKPQTDFTTTLHVDNLSRTELGALLWLLSLPESEGANPRPGHLRIGFGKPLGFGVVDVRFDATRTQLSLGADIRNSYLSFKEPDHASATDLQEIRDEYDDLLLNDTTLPAVRKSFLRAAWGEWGSPVHSPRPTPTPPTGAAGTEMFNWWMTNENPAGPRQNPTRLPRRLGLPLLSADDLRLPYVPYSGEF